MIMEGGLIPPISVDKVEVQKVTGTYLNNQSLE